MIVAISTPFGEAGLLFDKYEASYGKDDAQTLFVRGGTLSFNPTQSRERIERKLREDPIGAGADLNAEFRSETSAYCDRATLLAAIEKGVESRPVGRMRSQAFVDLSGGRRDSSVLAISTKEGERVIVQRVVEIPSPHDPAEACATFAEVLREFRLSVVHGDKYAGNWAPMAFKELGIHYRAADRDKSQLFLDALPLLTSGNAVLLDDRRAVEQFCRLRRVTGKGGRDRVEKRDGDRDDRANAIAGSLVVAGERAKRTAPGIMWAETASGGRHIIQGG